MKKSAIFTIVACSIAVVILAGVMVVGMTSDGFGIGTLLEGEPDAANGREYSYTWDPAETEVEGLDISWISGSIDLKVGSGPLIRITERSNRDLKENEKLELSSSNGTLKIKWNNEFISFSLFHNKSKSLTVEVPKEVAEKLEKLNCSNTSGTITASGFTAEEMEFSSTSGRLELSALNAQEADFNTTSGDIELDGVKAVEELHANTTSGSVRLDGASTEKATLNTVSGSVEYAGTAKELEAGSVSASVSAELDQCPERVDMDSVSGGLTLSIPENDGFEAEFSSVSGTFSSDFPTTGDSGKSGRALYSGGKAKFSFSTTSGSMEVRKH